MSIHDGLLGEAQGDSDGLRDSIHGPALAVPPAAAKPWGFSTRFLVVMLFVCGGAGLLIGLAVGLAHAGGGAPSGGGNPQLTGVKPIVVNTWFEASNQRAYNLTLAGFTALDAVEAGCTLCEELQCDGTVGFGGSPDAYGAVSLDALIIDATTHDVGAVTDLRGVRQAISAARKVLQYSRHTLLSGDGAANFSVMMGLPPQSTDTAASVAAYETWRTADPPCQPNFYANVVGGNNSCPPYAPVPTPTYTPVPQHAAEAAWSRQPRPANADISRSNHDTVGMCAIDMFGELAGGGSSNGASHKIAGRASDISVIGAGVYADRDGGCAAATGDGDITMRFLPAYQAVENMRNGMLPKDACTDAVRRIMVYYKSFQLGLVCLDMQGRHGGASHGWTFTYAVASPDTANQTQIIPVEPITS